MNKRPFLEVSLMEKESSLVKCSLNSGCVVALSPRYAVARSALLGSNLARVWIRLAAPSKTSRRRGCCSNLLPFEGEKDGVTASAIAAKMPHCAADSGSWLGSGGSGAAVASTGSADMINNPVAYPGFAQHGGPDAVCKSDEVRSKKSLS